MEAPTQKDVDDWILEMNMAQKGNDGTVQALEPHLQICTSCQRRRSPEMFAKSKTCCHCLEKAQAKREKRITDTASASATVAALKKAIGGIIVHNDRMSASLSADGWSPEVSTVDVEEDLSGAWLRRHELRVACELQALQGDDAREETTPVKEGEGRKCSTCRIVQPWDLYKLSNGGSRAKTCCMCLQLKKRRRNVRMVNLERLEGEVDQLRAKLRQVMERNVDLRSELASRKMASLEEEESKEEGREEGYLEELDVARSTSPP
jgi:hypothetical protein